MLKFTKHNNSLAPVRRSIIVGSGDILRLVKRNVVNIHFNNLLSVPIDCTIVIQMQNPG
jgi:hypothetical protein